MVSRTVSSFQCIVSGSACMYCTPDGVSWSAILCVYVPLTGLCAWGWHVQCVRAPLFRLSVSGSAVQCACVPIFALCVSRSAVQCVCMPLFAFCFQGQPSFVRVYRYPDFGGPAAAVANKSFYKADRVNMYWNKIGKDCVRVYVTACHHAKCQCGFSWVPIPTQSWAFWWSDRFVNEHDDRVVNWWVE